jgi:hypothetical protein
MRRNLPLLVIQALLLSLFSIFPVHNATADAFATWADVTFKADTAYLNSTESVQIDLTPLQTGTKMWRYLNVGWNNEEQSHRYSGQAGISMQSGSQNFTFAFYGARDVQFTTSSSSNGSCSRVNPYEFAGKTYLQAICSTSFQITQGHTYRIKIFNDSSMGPTWFKASIENLVNKSRTEIGSINVGDKSFNLPLSTVQYGMHDSTPSSSDCSKVEINDTIFSGVTSGSSTFNTFLGQSSDQCAKAVVSANKYSLGGNVIKFGGANPSERNLESGAALNSSSSPIRTPRAISEVPHPEEISPGLIQNRYPKYFSDDTKNFEVAPSSSIKVQNLPEYRASDGSAPEFSNTWTGYFIPDYTGTWRFRMTSDDAGYLYIGNNAVLGYSRNIKDATIDLGSTHVAQTTTVNVELIKDKIYPFRIIYGNAIDVSVLKVEFQAPGFATFQSDFTSLIWHSTPSECSNFGIDYVFVGDLGYEKAQLRTGKSLPNCTKNYAGSGSNTSSTNTESSKVIIKKPQFTLVNLVGNKINIEVNIGSAGTNRPDNVYLVAPKLGIIESKKLFGKISGSTVSWSIDFDKLLSGSTIPLKVIGVKNGIESEPSEQDFKAPASTSKNTSNKSVPNSPKNVKSRIVGSSAVITAEITTKANGNPNQAFLFAPSIGLTKSNALAGEIVGNKILFEVPIKNSMAGKKLPVTIYLSNEIGDSQPVQTVVSVPAAPKSPTPTIKPNGISCLKGSQTRNFAGKSCPPGWKNA